MTGRIWQIRGSSLLLLLGGHALCGWRMLTCNNYACEIRLEEVQGATACSFIPQPLLQDPRSCVQLMCPECDASCKRDLALDQSRSPALTSGRNRLDFYDRSSEITSDQWSIINRLKIHMGHIMLLFWCLMASIWLISHVRCQMTGP